ncbi:20477_t:CDS:2 [Funneliformis geosporum]|uniref:2919_t:CDS:1 n=1 Tax=Funneliformis geosporum TaxID=1117311 RepID=A0A9W4X253_9GLOM|nr:20477_t:CDS:2 [Funneliformis geosporum]CAI2180908.1 2919_t:CDS:2 [Funneliformis geosporum]
MRFLCKEENARQMNRNWKEFESSVDTASMREEIELLKEILGIFREEEGGGEENVKD